jgi:hypothetical protein
MPDDFPMVLDTFAAPSVTPAKLSLTGALHFFIHHCFQTLFSLNRSRCEPIIATT